MLLLLPPTPGICAGPQRQPPKSVREGGGGGGWVRLLLPPLGCPVSAVVWSTTLRSTEVLCGATMLQ